MPPADVDVCVIGSGLAGISAGLAAKAAGAEVVVLEASTAAGGKAQTVDGMERGPGSFNGRYEVFWRLLELLKLEGEAVELPASSATRYLARFGRLHALKPSPLTLLTTGALTFREKLALLADVVLRRPVAAAASLHDFFAQRFGASFASGPLAAMLSGIFTGDPHTLAVDGCFPGLSERATQERSVIRALMKGLRATTPGARRGFFTLKGGLGRIGAAAREHLRIELSCPVRELSRDANGFWVQGPRPLHARSVVVATEASAAAKLLWPLSPRLGAALGQLKYAPVTVTHWQGEQSGFGDGFGYLACPTENLFAMGTMFHEGHRYRTFVRGAEADDAQLEAGIAGDVQRLTGGRFGKLVRVDRWAQAVFQPTVEALPVRDSLPGLSEEAGVVLAGSYLGASAMKDALASGFAAGQKAAQVSQRTPAWSRSLS
ncbi:MAG: FAD-dependent oxidoreductase [Archangiaceae bacterium]|nr:FAD-dependent oxidoreductase [Archangiaceae bacterium]